MDLTRLFILMALSLAAGLLIRLRPSWRPAVLLGMSVGVLFWLQPSTPIRNLSFWLPIVSLALAIGVWGVTTDPRPSTAKTDAATETQSTPTPMSGLVRIRQFGARHRATIQTLVVVSAVVLLFGLTRYIDLPVALLPARPPDILAILAAIIITLVLSLLAVRFTLHAPRLTPLIIAFIALFVLIKLDITATLISALLRVSTGQIVAEASPLDLRWLGFSYIAFRLIHVLRERQNGKLPNLTLQEFLIYVMFFPSVSAGPIDRVERFLKDLRAPYTVNAEVTYDVGRRILVGVFKKYVLADTLALIALNEINAAQIRSGAAGWAWLIVYAYALRIYFDFSGYTDIATGLGRWFGIKLPENFNAPYLKPNLTQFWNSWHMSLSQWFRAYWFNPLTRALRQRKWEQAQIVFVGQASTMLLIALWHGITPNFVAWGVWHALGLFVHNRWAEFAKARDLSRFARVGAVLGPILTFHFVALGWVWFALPSLGLSLQTFARMVGR